MSTSHLSFPGFRLLAPPYRTMEPMPPEALLHRSARDSRGCALIWSLGEGPWDREVETAWHRPPGMALIMILPPAEQVDSRSRLLQAIERCSPHSVLPFHDPPEVEDIQTLLRRPPDSVAAAVTDYLRWRGLQIDAETRRLVRKTLELSDQITTVSGLARSLYLSRRALGRRFMSRGLPVPSHWLQFGRILRATFRFQAGTGSLFAVACDLGYPDGFSLSNQMKRLCDVRPSEVRESLGWEWVVEAWLAVEKSEGNLQALSSGRPFPARATAAQRVAEAAQGVPSGSMTS